jgi:LysM repeat protein
MVFQFLEVEPKLLVEPALQKLTIEVVHPKSAGGEATRFTALFNPEEYTINKDNAYAVQGIPGLGAPLVQFVNGNLRTLEMELFFDTYANENATKHDVRDLTGAFAGLMEINPDLHAPPILLVSWATLQFTCVLARVSQKFILFANDGKPVRARLTVTFNEVVDAEQEAKRANLQTSDFTKLHVVKEGETLGEIARAYYEDARLWRPIAIANGLDDPRSIVAGQDLRVPSLPYSDPTSHESVA